MARAGGTPKMSNALPSSKFVGVDVGGTTITAVVVDAQLQLLGQQTFPTDISSPSQTLKGIVAAIQTSLASCHTRFSELAGVGLGIPGRVDSATGDVHLAVNLNWQDVAAGAWLSQTLGVPCYVENDLHLAALGYYHFFAQTPVQNMAYVSVGTGVAAGLILDGRLYRGSHGMAGEFGHMVIDPQGPRCNCGNQGCLEMYVAGPAYSRAGQQAIEEGRLAIAIEGETVTAVDIFQAAQTGDPAAQQIIDTAGAHLGRGLQALIMTYDIDKIVLGGGLIQAGELYRQSILQEWQRQAHISPLAAEMLTPDKLEYAPTNKNAGAWGGIMLAVNRQADPILLPHTALHSKQTILKEVVPKQH